MILLFTWVDYMLVEYQGGGIDYSKLHFAHKTMMKLLYNAVKNLPEERQTAENKAMIETYNKKVNFVDFSSME